MTTDEKRREDEQLESALVEHHLLLSAGDSVADESDRSTDLAPQLASILQDSKSLLRMMHQVWPSTPSESGARNRGTDDTSKSRSSGPLESIGRFEIIEELGRGGSAVVFLASDPILERLVALKVPRPEVLATHELRRRFIREAKAAARLHHPNLIAVHETGEDGPLCFIAAEYCEGPTMSSWINVRSKAVPVRVAARIVMELAEAVEYAHQNGVLHRDIKPGNILLKTETRGETPSNEKDSVADSRVIPKLTDFGLAKCTHHDGDDTRSGVVMGTPCYMAPEQAKGQTSQIGPRTDVYGLGVVLYELLSGGRPFRGDSDTETLRQVVSEEPRPISEMRGSVARDLEAICMMCMEKEPHRRYSTAGALAEDIHRFLAGRPTQARPAGLPRRIAKWVRRRPATATFAALAAAALAFVAGSGWWYSGRLNAMLSTAQHLRIEADQQRELASRQKELADQRAEQTRRYAYAADMKLAEQAVGISDSQKAIEILSRYRTDGAHEDLCSFEWDYLWRLCHQETHILSGHDGEAYAVAFSPDGLTLASGAENGTVRLWDVATGACVNILSGHASCVNAVAFGSGGKTVATASCDGTARLWDAADGKCMSILKGTTAPVRSLAFSADGALLATADATGRIRLWNAMTGVDKGELLPANGKSAAVALDTTGGVFVAAGSDGHLRTFDQNSSNMLSDRDLHLGRLAMAVPSPDGKTLAIVAADVVFLLDRSSMKTKAELRGHSRGIESVAYSPDGTLLVTAGDDQRICVWEMATGDLRTSYVAHSGRVNSVRFSPDGTLIASAGNDGTVRLWRASLRPINQRLGFDTPVVDVDFSPDQSLLAVATDADVSFFDTGTWQRRATLPTRAPVAFSPSDGPYGFAMAVLLSDRAVVFDVNSLEEVFSLQVAGGPIRHAVFSPDGSALVISLEDEDATTCLYDLRSRSERARYSSKVAHVHDLAISADGQKLVLADVAKTDATLVELPTMRAIRRFNGHADHVEVVRFSPSGQLVATGSQDRSVKIWNVADGADLLTLAGHSSGIRSLCFSPDGRTLSTGGFDGQVKLWSVATGQELISLEGHSGQIAAMTFSDDGKLLVSGGTTPDGGGEVLIWSANRATDAFARMAHLANRDFFAPAPGSLLEPSR